MPMMEAIYPNVNGDTSPVATQWLSYTYSFSIPYQSTYQSIVTSSTKHKIYWQSFRILWLNTNRNNSDTAQQNLNLDTAQTINV